MNAGRLQASTKLLFEDLKRQELRDATLELNHDVTLPSLGQVMIPIYVQRADGTELFVGLCEPLTRETPANAVLGDLKQAAQGFEVVLCDEIVVSRNLPAATNYVLEEVGKG